MARLESQAKLLYYPTPESIVDILATWFSGNDKKGLIRLADPACGTGEALVQFAGKLHPPVTPQPVGGISTGFPLETWGIEISYARAAQAEQVLDLVVPASFYDLRSPGNWPTQPVSLLFNNPPYDWSNNFEIRGGEKRRIRHEVLFIEACTPKLVPGGHHVMIIPRGILGDERLLGSGQHERIARHLNGWYEEVQIFRFPDEEYAKFKQVVILACRKRAKYQPPMKETLARFVALAREQAFLPVLTTGNQQYLLPGAPAKATLVYTPLRPKDVLRAAQKATPLGTAAYQRVTYVRPLGAPFQPAMPLKVGDLSNLLLGQETGSVLINKGQTLVKGSSRKVIDADTVDVTDEEGTYAHTDIVETERHQAQLAVAHADGRLVLLSADQEIVAFMDRFAGELGEAVLGKNPPLYNFNPTPKEWERASRSGLGLPPLPGVHEPGLFPIQKHFGIGAVRVMKQRGQAIVEAEPGFGKTLVATLSLEVMDKWPALVMCPGHMVRKWKRTLEASSDPEQPIVARVITRPVLKEPPAWLSIREGIEKMGGQVVETLRLQVEPVSPGDPCERRWVKLACAPEKRMQVAAIFNTLTFRDKWRDPDHRWKRQEVPAKIQFTQAGLAVEYVDRDVYTLRDFLADYQKGRLGQKAVAIISFERAKYDAGMAVNGKPADDDESDNDAKPGAVKPAVMWRWTRDPESDQLLKRPICPVCGAFVPYEKKRGREEWVIAKACAEESCRTKLYNFTRWRRVGLARLLQRKFRHVFKVYIADEIQKCKEGDTDTGVADQRLLSSIRYGLALTGTIFGGTAGSLFYLLYRRSREIRRLYAFDDLRRWVDHYGRWERSWKQEKPYVVGQGASTGIKRWGYRQKEIPGVAPGVIRYLLPLTLMAGLSDLGYELPPLEETVQEVPFTPEQENIYATLAEDLLSDALALVKEHGDRGVLAAWFNALRFWPNSGFRQEIIHYQSHQQNPLTKQPKFIWHHELPPVVSRSRPWLPKEIALADVVRANMARGRKTLVYLEQTATRDIRPRLQTALESLVPGGDVSLIAVPKFVFHQQPKVGLLNASIAPERREAWVAAHTPALDTLLVNPRLVETGLDLVIFSSLVFYEVTPSLYLFLQAMRRVWRLGQDKAVEVTYLVYQNSIEAEMLRRIGQKLKAAILLHGEHALGALIEQDSDDLLREIIRDRMKGKAFENMGEALGEVVVGMVLCGKQNRTRPTMLPKEISSLSNPIPVQGNSDFLVEAPQLVVTKADHPFGKVMQLSLFGEQMPVVSGRQKRGR